jgi:uncharacterized protein YxjI
MNQNFSLRDRFTILDAEQKETFTAEGEMWSLTKKIMLKTMSGEDLLFIDEKFNWLLPTFEFYIGEDLICEMKREMTFFKKKYAIVTPNWQIEGDIWDHNYEIKEGNDVIASINKEFFSWMDAYEIDVFVEEYTELILGIVIAIDADLEDDE